MSNSKDANPGQHKDGRSLLTPDDLDKERMKQDIAEPTAVPGRDRRSNVDEVRARQPEGDRVSRR